MEGLVFFQPGSFPHRLQLDSACGHRLGNVPVYSSLQTLLSEENIQIEKRSDDTQNFNRKKNDHPGVQIYGFQDLILRDALRPSTITIMPKPTIEITAPSE